MLSTSVQLSVTGMLLHFSISCCYFHISLLLLMLMYGSCQSALTCLELLPGSDERAQSLYESSLLHTVIGRLGQLSPSYPQGPHIH